MKATVRLGHDDDWYSLFDATAKTLFVPDARAPVGSTLATEVLFPNGGPTVRFTGVCAAVEPDGCMIHLSPNDRSKLNYVHAYVRGGMLNVRTRPRVPVRLDVAYGGVNGTVETVCRDVNDEGVFIVTQDPLPVGSRLHLLFNVGVIDTQLQLVGLVSHAATAPRAEVPGMGIVFEVSGEQKRQVVEMVRRIEAALQDGRLRPFVLE